MACLGSPRVISTRLLQCCRAISWPPAAKLGGAPSWRLQFHRDPAKARDEQKRKGLNTHKQTKQLFFLGKSLYFMIKPNLNKKRFQPTENWEFFPHEIEGFTKNRDLLMKPLGKSGKTGIGTHVLQISGGWWNVQEKLLGLWVSELSQTFLKEGTRTPFNSMANHQF